MNPLIIRKKNAHIIIYFVVLLILVSCGKENTINRNMAADPGPTAPQAPTPVPVVPTPYPEPTIPSAEQIINQDMMARIEQAKSRFPCKNNAQRLEFHHHILVNNPTQPYIPMGQLVQGPGPGGTISKVYMGLYPNYNDFLIVKDISQGDQIVARSVTLSLCQLHPIILPDRPLVFNMATPLNVTENPNCVIGNVKGDYLISSEAYGNYQRFTIRNVFINFAVCEAQNNPYYQ